MTNFASERRTSPHVVVELDRRCTINIIWRGVSMDDALKFDVELRRDVHQLLHLLSESQRDLSALVGVITELVPKAVAPLVRRACMQTLTRFVGEHLATEHVGAARIDALVRSLTDRLQEAITQSLLETTLCRHEP